MTKAEFLKSKEYEDMMEKIRSYRQGFEFTIPFYKMTQQQKNGMNIVLHDAVEEGLIESIQIGVSIEGNFTDETYKRL